MRNLKTFLIATTAIVALSSCSKDNNTPQPAKPTPGLQGNGKVSLQFENYVGEEKLTLGADANAAKAYTSNGQTLKFSEVKYVISNIRLIKTDGKVVDYNSDNLDTGAFVLDQSKPSFLSSTMLREKMILVCIGNGEKDIVLLKLKVFGVIKTNLYPFIQVVLLRTGTQRKLELTPAVL